MNFSPSFKAAARKREEFFFMDVEAGLLELVRDHIARQPDLVNARDESLGATPLMLACGAKQTAVAEFLLERGAEINARDENDWTPLMYTVLGGDARLAETLLRRGASPDAAESNGRTALILAAQEGAGAIMKILMTHGADIEHRDGMSRCALDHLHLRGHSCTLLEQGLAALEEKRKAEELEDVARKIRAGLTKPLKVEPLR